MTEDAELGKSDPQTTRHIHQDTCTSMLLFRLKPMLELCATFIFLLVFQIKKSPSRCVRLHDSQSLVLFLLCCLCSSAVLHCEAGMLNPGDSKGRSRTSENEIEQATQLFYAVFTSLHSDGKKQSLKENLVLLATESFYTYVPTSFVNRGAYAFCFSSMLSRSPH